MSAAAHAPARLQQPAASAMAIALALAAVYVIWGSTYLAMRLAMVTLPPFTMAAVRHSIAGVILYLFARARGAARPRLAHWGPAAIIGALLLLAGNGGVAWAEQRVGSGMAALLICSEPMWIVLLVWLLPGGRRPTLPVLGGLLLASLGLLILVRPSGGAAFAVDPAGAAVLLIAAISWAAGSVYVQRATLPESPLLATAMQMLCGGGLLFAAAAATGESSLNALAHVSTGSALAVVYLIAFGSLVGFTCYTWLLRVAPPVLVSTYAYVNPVVAVLLGWWLAKEAVTTGTLVGAAVILCGVALLSTVSHGSRPAPDAARAPDPAPALRQPPAAGTSDRRGAALELGGGSCAG